MKQSSQIILLLLVIALPKTIYGASSDIPTFFLDIGTGITTYKSEALESNDTSVTLGYMFGVYAGQNKEIGFALNSEQNTTDFEYAGNELKSSMNTTFQDTIISYRLGPAYIGATFNQITLESTKQDAEYLNLMGSGIGGSAGLIIQFRKDSKVFLNVIFSNASVTKDTIQDSNTVSLGSRTDIHMGGIIQLTRTLTNLQIGYKQRTYGLTVAGTSYTETLSYTWIGLGFNLSF